MPVILDHIFMALWRSIGALAWPLLWLYPHSRRHIWNVPGPTPGRTWVHGASLGEHQNAAALVPYLGPVWRTHSSWRSHPHGSFPAPMDLPFAIEPWLNRTRPSRLILLEGELWPGWLIACRTRGIPVAVLAARRGPGWRRWQRIPKLFSWLTREVQFLYSDDVGDLKRAAPRSAPAFPMPPGTIVGASTRPGDEERLVDAWSHLAAPRPKLVLAPRHLDRTKSILQLLQAHRVGLRSQGFHEADDIWLLDTHGELAGVVAVAHIVMIGGTFDRRVGGHSPAEAASGQAHIVHGPHTGANPTAWKDLESHPVTSTQGLHAALESLGKRPLRKPECDDIDIAAIIDVLPRPVWIPERHRFRALWPLVPIWKGMTWMARRLQRGKSERTFVVVGGLVNGGAGRTPAAAWLAEQLTDAHVISAGYRRKDSGPQIRWGHPAEPPTHDLGDELEMMRRRGLPVTSAPNRMQAIEQLPPNCLPIIDGGLGDPRLQNGFRIACIDGKTPLGRGPFPVGHRRLPWSTLHQVNAIWITNPSSDTPVALLPPDVPVIRSSMRPAGWIHRGKLYPLDAVQGSVDVVVGIANPDRFINALSDLGLHIRNLRVTGDHDPLGSVGPDTVLTEKDAARLPIDANVWALRMELDVDGGDSLLQQIVEHSA